MRHFWILVPLGLASGCAQLVLFEQPLIGPPDTIEASDPGDLLCDEDVRLGGRALCATSCIFEGGDDGSEVACDGRVRTEEGRLVVDPSGFFEAEITFTVCEPLERESTFLTSRGTGLAFVGRDVELRDTDGATLDTEERVLPDEDCQDRSLLVQDGRLELVERGQRWCTPGLPRFDESWRIDRSGFESIEICFRRSPRESGRRADVESASVERTMKRARAANGSLAE